MALDATTTALLVDRFIVSRSGPDEGATAAELAKALKVTDSHARALLGLYKNLKRHRAREAADVVAGSARLVLFAKLATPEQINDARDEFKVLANGYRASRPKGGSAGRGSEGISRALERAEHALFVGDLADARIALTAVGRPHDRLSGEMRRTYAARQSIASANEAMQRGQFELAARIAMQLMNHEMPLDRHLELRATYGAALRMNPARLGKSVEIYTDGIRLAEEAGTAGRARLRHLLTARSAPLVALGHAAAAIGDLHRAVALAPDEFSDAESRLCRVRALYIAGDFRSAEQHWPEVLPVGSPLWLARWHERFRLAFLPAGGDADVWNARAIRVWNDNKDHGFQRKLIAAMVLRSSHARRDAWDPDVWTQLEDAAAPSERGSLFLAT